MAAPPTQGLLQGAGDAPARLLPGLGGVPGFSRRHDQVGQQSRKDQARAAVTSSNPAGGSGRVNDRASPRPAQSETSPSPYRLATPTRAPPLGRRARPRSLIGRDCGASHAPARAARPGRGHVRPSSPSAWLPVWPQCDPPSGPSTPRSVSPPCRAHVVPLAPGVGAPGEGLGRGPATCPPSGERK